MDLFQSLPKVNLHHHLEGAVRITTFLELANRHGLNVSTAGIEQTKALLQVEKHDHSLADFLVKVDRSLLVSQFPGTLTRIAFEIAEDAYKQNVKYLELRFGPWLHLQQRLHLEAAIEEVLAGLKQAEEQYPILTGLIVCALRHHDCDQNMKLVKTAIKYLGQGLTGFDIAGDEASYPAARFRKVFAYADDNGLGITVHAGEVTSGSKVIEAIEKLNAKRIGHGIRIASNPKLIDKVKAHGVTLEVCPTSNVHTGAVKSLVDHPIRELYEHGVAISLGDDDPTTSNITISSEYRLLKEKLNFSCAELKDLVIMGAKAAFLPQHKQQELGDQMLKLLSIWEKRAIARY